MNSLFYVAFHVFMLFVFVAGSVTITGLMARVIYEAAVRYYYTHQNKKLQRNLAVASILIGIVLYTLLMAYFVVASYFDKIPEDMNKEIVNRFPHYLAIMSLVLGVVAYLVRCRLRLLYAIAEIIVGIIATFDAGLSSDATSTFQLIAGIYIIVRGMDNLDKAVSWWPSVKPVWDGIFGARR